MVQARHLLSLLRSTIHARARQFVDGALNVPLQSSGLRYVSVRPEQRSSTVVATSGARRADTHAGPTMRVVRLVDGDRPARASGRLVISGRMADVCAELERLAAMESQAA